MSISRLLSVFVMVVLVVTVLFAVPAGKVSGAAMSSGQNLAGCVQAQPGSAIPANYAASDWVARHAASVKAGNAVDLPDYIQRHSGSAIPADRGAASDWVERHAASLNADNAVNVFDCAQPVSAVPADRGAAPDWVERHAASLTASNVADLSH